MSIEDKANKYWALKQMRIESRKSRTSKEYFYYLVIIRRLQNELGIGIKV